MQAYWTLTRRELGGYFLSLSGYTIIAAALFLMGFSFVDLLVLLRDNPTPTPVTELFYNTQFFWQILLLATPIITMRLFALEKFSGTFETLMTAPVSDVEVVLAKFSAALTFYLVMWLPLLACLMIVRHYSNQASALDPGAVGAMFLGILLFGCPFIAAGCFGSALSRSQGVAAMVSLVFGTSLYLLAFLADQAPAQISWQSELLGFFTFFQHMRDFARGVVDTRPVVLLVTLTIFFLSLTLRVLESRRWR